MKVKRIESIDDFGIFSSYKAIQNNPSDFDTNNIVFGWNYSGKTTLSRIFRSLEQNKPHDDFQDGKFRIRLDDDSVITEREIGSYLLRIRVFNSDYVRANLHWEKSDGGMPPILVLGEENIELERQFASISKEIKESQDKLAAQKRENTKLNDNLDSALTNEATRISRELSLVRNFRRPDLEALLNQPSVTEWELSEKEFRETQKSLHANIPLEKLDELEFSLDKNLLNYTLELLQTVVTPSKSIERLKDSPKVEDWVRQGRELHVNQTKCLFCQNDLPSGFLQELDAHFSKEYESFRNKVKEHIAKLERAKLDVPLKSINDLYPKLQEQYSNYVSELKEQIGAYNAAIDQLIEHTKRKLDNLSKPMIIDTSIQLDIGGVTKLVQQINLLFQEHNEITDNFAESKTKNTEMLKRHYAAEFYKSSVYGDKKEKIREWDKSINNITQEIKRLEDQVKHIEEQLSTALRGAEILNCFLRQYFGPNTPIQISVQKIEEQERFQIIREGREATNLSEGEKTAIAFAYFLASLEDKNTKEHLADTIVFVDDPVSSLDSNHIYNTFALIRTRIQGKCKQSFIATHNVEFFNLLAYESKTQLHRDCPLNPLNKKEKSICKTNLFEIERNSSNARLKNLDCTLCRFDSEYQYLFYQLVQFEAEQSDIDNYKLYTMPNILRRFLETYIRQRYPSCTGSLKNGLKQVFPGDQKETERNFVHKIVDELSHGQNISRTIRLSPPDEIGRAIDMTFNALDKEYLEDLKRSVGL